MSPKPTGIHQITLNAKKMNEFITKTVRNSRDHFHERSFVLLEKQPIDPDVPDDTKFKPNNFLSPILWSFHNECVTPVLVGDHPRLLLIEHLAKNMPLTVIHDILGKAMSSYKIYDGFKSAIKEAEAELAARRIEYMRSVLLEAKGYDKIVALVGDLTRAKVRRTADRLPRRLQHAPEAYR